MDLSTIAVPHTLAHLKPLLPAPPARVLEVGCGRGALAAASLRDALRTALPGPRRAAA